MEKLLISNHFKQFQRKSTKSCQTSAKPTVNASLTAGLISAFSINKRYKNPIIKLPKTFTRKVEIGRLISKCLARLKPTKYLNTAPNPPPMKIEIKFKYIYFTFVLIISSMISQTSATYLAQRSFLAGPSRPPDKILQQVTLFLFLNSSTIAFAF